MTDDCCVAFVESVFLFSGTETKRAWCVRCFVCLSLGVVASWHVDLSCCEDFVVEIMPVFRCNSTVMHRFFLLQECVFGARCFLIIYLFFYIFYSMFVESFSDVLFCVA